MTKYNAWQVKSMRIQLNSTEIKKRSREIFEDNDFVKKVYLFGSYARGDANEKSDIDFLIETNREVGLEFFGLYDYLQEEFKKSVDVITVEEAMKIMGSHIEKDKVLIYER